MKVTYFDNEVKLGPKEFKLLTLLIERPGHIFSRGKLLDLVWGMVYMWKKELLMFI